MTDKVDGKPSRKKMRLTADMRKYFSVIGKLGGSAGGHKRAANLTRKRRREIALMGAEARIAKYKQQRRPVKPAA